MLESSDLALRAADKLVQHRVPRERQVVAIIAAAAKPHDASARELVGELAQATRGMRMSRRRVLQMRKRIAGETVRAALENDEFGPESPQEFRDPLPFAHE